MDSFLCVFYVRDFLALGKCRNLCHLPEYLRRADTRSRLRIGVKRAQQLLGPGRHGLVAPLSQDYLAPSTFAHARAGRDTVPAIDLDAHPLSPTTKRFDAEKQNQGGKLIES